MDQFYIQYQWCKRQKVAKEKRMTILIIDDEKIIRERLKKLLEIDDYQVVCAENGQKGLELYIEIKPQIILLDIKMPVMDGIEVLLRIKSEEQANDPVEVIMITGHGGVDTAIEALKGGAFSYIQKPIEYDELEIEIKRALDKIQMKKALDEHVQKLEERTNDLIKANVKRQQSEEKVRKTNDKLLKANKEIKETQIQLVQSAKLASIGELATGIAHELYQPITYIRGNSQLVMMDGEKNLDISLVWPMLKSVEHGTTIIMKIISHLREYAKKSDGIWNHINIHEIIENSFILLNEQFRLSNIEVEKIFAADIPDISADPYQLEQVFANMLSNARDALKGIDNAKLIIQTEFCDTSNEVRIKFIDNGCGISQKIQKNIFMPFFTTKDLGTGTGLGSSISAGIINDHKGQISVFSEEGKGATFIISLPTVKDEDSPPII